MKIVKFQRNLVPLVLDGSKVSTWRLFDDKNLSTNDQIELREFGETDAFAFAVITDVIEKEFGQLSADDKLGHESYSDDKEMYDTYSQYYSAQVGPSTKLKIIRFELLGSS